MYAIKRRLLAALLMGAAALPWPAFGAGFPDHPVRLIIPGTAGGTTDILGRYVAQKLSERWGQTVVVDNRVGGLGVVGAEALARSKPDGYTMGLMPSNHAIVPLVVKGLTYDVKKDFVPVAPVATIPGLLVVNKAMDAAHNAREAFDIAKASPNRYNYASPIALTTGHRTMELLKHATGADIQHIPYKGGPQAVTDLIGGQVQFLVISIPTVIEHVKSGRLRALAVTTRQRFVGLPDIPTLAESGFPNFESADWCGMFMPAGVPADVVQKMASDIKAVLSAPDVQQHFVAMGAVANPGMPKDLQTQFNHEYDTWARLLKDIKLQVD